jgi:hypothetical protein
MKKSFLTPWTREFFADLFIYFSFCRLAQSVLLFCLFFSDNEDPKKYAATAPIVDAPVIDEPPSQEAAVVPKSPEAAAKGWFSCFQMPEENVSGEYFSRRPSANYLH